MSKFLVNLKVVDIVFPTLRIWTYASALEVKWNVILHIFQKAAVNSLPLKWSVNQFKCSAAGTDMYFMSINSYFGEIWNVTVWFNFYVLCGTT